MVDREQLRRDLSDALEAFHRDRTVDGLAELADTIRTLGPTYRSHGELMRAALHPRKRQHRHLAPDPRAGEVREGRLVEARRPRLT
jgi:hypothetical protein